MTVLLDLRDAHLVASPDLSPVEAKAVAMLVHEVERRTGIARRRRETTSLHRYLPPCSVHPVLTRLFKSLTSRGTMK